MEHLETIRELIAKYNRPGPRYTSYPTAPHFRDHPDLEALIADSVAVAAPASLYIHIPFCESNCWFCGCNTIITNRHSRADGYLDLLEKEVALLNNCYPQRRAVRSIHLGGGTPNFLSAAQIGRLFGILKNGFVLDSELDLSVELAPNYLSEEQLDAFVAEGLSRASFGIQDLDPAVQKAINRVQPQEVNARVMTWLRDRGIQSVNIDLIYGLPLQSPESYRRTLDQVMMLAPDRLAVFNYAHVPHLKPFQKKLERHAMPDPQTKIAILLSMITYLQQAGFEYIGMDHFAKPNDELCIAQKAMQLHRNFQGYTVQEEPEVIALGVSGISETPGTYRQNHKTLEAYERDLIQGKWPVAKGLILTEEDLCRREVIRSVMCNLRLDLGVVRARYPSFAMAIESNMRNDLASLENDGLVTLRSDGLEVTALGRLFLRNIAMVFDAYLPTDLATYSRTV